MNALRQALIDGDVKAACAVWRSIAPHLPEPPSDEAATAALHLARTGMSYGMPVRLRYYSHRWLTERGLPSQLPDGMRPRAERMYPRKVDAVGVAVRSAIPVVRDAITGAMNYAVEDCYANGDRDPLIVKPQMMAARARERRGLMLPREVT